MSNADLNALVSLFAQTHRALQQRAARTVDRVLVVRNWLFGYYLVEYEGAGASRADLYGKALIAEVSAALTSRGIKGLSPTNLRKCRAFYETYKDAGDPRFARDGSPPSPRIQQAPPVESSPAETLVTALRPAGNLADATFELDNDHFYVDLVFYNRLLRCYVLLDLKLDKLTHQDLGQMQMYVNYFDRHVKTAEEAPTIGILLCRRKSDALVELTLPEDANIHASEYQLYLPSKEELQKKLMAWTRELET